MINLLPKIYYDLAIRNETPKTFVIPDLMTRIKLKISEKDLNNMTFNYIMVDGDTPELISLNFYNSMEFHWVIMFINERYDYINDFPMRYETLEPYCQRKYGVENLYATHHYEDTEGNVVDEYYYDYKNKYGLQPKGDIAQEPIWKTYYQYSHVGTDMIQLKTIEALPVTNFEYEDRLNESKRLIKLIKPEHLADFVDLYQTTLKEYSA